VADSTPDIGQMIFDSGDRGFLRFARGRSILDLRLDALTSVLRVVAA
jgi:hypothetical protein